MTKKHIALAASLAVILIVLAGLFLSGIFKNPQNSDEVRIYFSKLAGSKIISEYVIRKVPKKESPITTAINALIKGPTEKEKDQGYYSEIPVGTRVINVKETPEDIRINLNEQFTTGGGSASMVARMNEVTNTALDAEPTRKVFLDIDGQQLDVLGGEGIEITQPLEKTTPETESSSNE